MKKLILASSSKGRLDLLKKIYITPDRIISPEIDETPIKKESPSNLAKRLAFEKGGKVYNELKDWPEDAVILSGDTVACIGRAIMEKTNDEKTLLDFLQKSSGKTVKVYSGYCVFDLTTGIHKVGVVSTKVKLKRLSREEIDFYMKTGEGYGKAGGFTVNGFAECFVEKIVGSFSNVVGMPLTEVNSALRSFGYHRHFKKI